MNVPQAITHRIPLENGDVLTVIEAPEWRVTETPYPTVYPDGGNVFWRVRYTLIEPGEDDGRRFLTLVVPCGVAYLSAPPENTLSLIAQEAQDQVDTSAKEMAESSGAGFTVEGWQEILKVWRGWYVALGEFFGPYFRDVMEFLTVYRP